MTSAYETAAQAALDYFLADPAGGPALAVCRDGIRANRYGHLGAVIRQQHRHGDWPAEQVACFAIVYSEVCSGDVAQVQISAGGTPHADAERSSNARLLHDLPPPFEAFVHPGQNNDDQDGYLRWAEPIQVETSTGRPQTAADGTTAPELVVGEVPPGSAPLEIGTTSASTTLMHLRRERAVARWPYWDH